MARHALLIGISQFSDRRLRALNAPAGDVDALGTILRDPDRGGFDSVEVSLDEEYLVVRDRLAVLFEDRDPDDLLLLYYSGHGILGRGNRLFLATTSSNLDRPPARSLWEGEIRDLMDQTRAERQIVVLDCCHSGAFADGAKSASAAPAVGQDTFDTAAAGRYVLAAANAMQFAWDGDALREGSPADRHLSRFTAWLVDGIGRGEASPDNEQITMDALFRYVCRRAKAEGSQATPQRYVDRGTDDLVIARNPAAASPPWQALLHQLAKEDWATRMAATERLGQLARRPGGMPEAERDTLLEALSDQLGVERDYKVRAAMRQLLSLFDKQREEMEQQQRAAAERRREEKAEEERKAAEDAARQLEEKRRTEMIQIEVYRQVEQITREAEDRRKAEQATREAEDRRKAEQATREAGEKKAKENKERSVAYSTILYIIIAFLLPFFNSFLELDMIIIITLVGTSFYFLRKAGNKVKESFYACLMLAGFLIGIALVANFIATAQPTPPHTSN